MVIARLQRLLQHRTLHGTILTLQLRVALLKRRVALLQADHPRAQLFDHAEKLAVSVRHGEAREGVCRANLLLIPPPQETHGRTHGAHVVPALAQVVQRALGGGAVALLALIRLARGQVKRGGFPNRAPFP